MLSPAIAHLLLPVFAGPRMKWKQWCNVQISFLWQRLLQINNNINDDNNNNNNNNNNDNNNIGITRCHKSQYPRKPKKFIYHCLIGVGLGLVLERYVVNDVYAVSKESHYISLIDKPHKIQPTCKLCVILSL